MLHLASRLTFPWSVQSTEVHPVYTCLMFDMPLCSYGIQDNDFCFCDISNDEVVKICLNLDRDSNYTLFFFWTSHCSMEQKLSNYVSRHQGLLHFLNIECLFFISEICST